MRVWTLAAMAATLIGGTTAAQTSATPSPERRADPVVPAAAAKPVRTEQVCKAEPIANSRLKKKKICTSRADYERTRNAQKQMVRDQMQRGGEQANQGGG